MNGTATTIIMGRKGMEETKDIQAVRYIAPVRKARICGFYKVEKANFLHIDDAKYPVRIRFGVGEWQKLEHPAKFGIQRAAFRGCCMSRDEFFRLCREQMVDEPAPDSES